MQWERIGCAYFGNGGKNTLYGVSENLQVRIESRKRKIQHANDVGYWDYTSFFVMKDGKDMREFRTLKEAKVWAEMLINKERMPK